MEELEGGLNEIQTTDLNLTLFQRPPQLYRSSPICVATM